MRRRRRVVGLTLSAIAVVIALVAVITLTRATIATSEKAGEQLPSVYPVPGVLATIARQVADVRTLPLRNDIQARVTDPATFADEVAALTLTPEATDALRSDERVAKALGLLGSDTDLVALTEALTREQAIGLYAPDDKTMHVGSPDGEISSAVAWSVAHESVHALQDQSYDLPTLFDLPADEADRADALLALVEGDAVVTQEIWSRRFQTAAERAEIAPLAGDPAVTAAGYVPRYVREAFTFPYAAGADFVAAIVREDGFEALNEVYANLPQSTEQILHPDKYRSREAPIPVEFSVKPGMGWQPDLDRTFGETQLAQTLRPLGEGRAQRLAAGWGGARLRSWTRDDATAVVIAVTMDTAAEAEELCAELPDWWRAADGVGAMQHRCHDRDVEVVVAPDEATARTLVNAIMRR